jgi:hypothetical protein
MRLHPQIEEDVGRQMVSMVSDFVEVVGRIPLAECAALRLIFGESRRPLQ